MRKIAHRGLLTGPNANLENRPEQIEKALALGYEVEVDVWHITTRQAGSLHSDWWLGHDQPTYMVSQSFLERDNLWLHMKNTQGVQQATPDMHWFCHDEDDMTLTSRGILWLHPRIGTLSGKPYVCVLPEWHLKSIKPEEIAESLSYLSTLDAHGICTDYWGILK